MPVPVDDGVVLAPDQDWWLGGARLGRGRRVRSACREPSGVWVTPPAGSTVISSALLLTPTPFVHRHRWRNTAFHYNDSMLLAEEARARDAFACVREPGL